MLVPSLLLEQSEEHVCTAGHGPLKTWHLPAPRSPGLGPCQHGWFPGLFPRHTGWAAIASYFVQTDEETEVLRGDVCTGEDTELKTVAVLPRPHSLHKRFLSAPRYQVLVRDWTMQTWNLQASGGKGGRPLTTNQANDQDNHRWWYERASGKEKQGAGSYFWFPQACSGEHQPLSTTQLQTPTGSCRRNLLTDCIWALTSVRDAWISSRVD